jgi:hypothetical protein
MDEAEKQAFKQALEKAEQALAALLRNQTIMQDQIKGLASRIADLEKKARPLKR